MAEIKIEKKSPIWPWILLIILILAVIVYYVSTNTDGDSIFDNETNTEVRDTISNVHPAHGTTMPYMGTLNAVQEFESSVTDSVRIGVDSTYTKTAIVNLARVVTLKADELDVQSSMALENLKFYSDPNYTTTDTELPADKDVYGNFKTVSKDIVTVLESIQSENYPSLKEDILELKQTSSKIDTNIATKEQQVTVQTFFTKAKKVVNDMNT
jgi:hypothetical protein